MIDRVQVRRSARRKRSIALRLQDDGSVLVMAPTRMTDRQIKQYVARKSAWIAKQRAKLSQAGNEGNDYRDGGVLSYLGQRYAIQCVIGAPVNIHLDGEHLTLQLPASEFLQPENIAFHLRAWCCEQANQQLPERVEAQAARMGETIAAVQIKNYRSRWGSCTRQRMIQLNWKLIFCPSAVIDYVVVHELCHLKHFNHSPAFWAEVARTMPDYQQHKVWLKQNGRAFIADQGLVV